MLRSFPGLRDFHQELSLEKKADWICLPFNHQFYRQKWTQLINYLSQRAEIWYASYWWPWLRTQQISLISLQQFFFSILGLSWYSSVKMASLRWTNLCFCSVPCRDGKAIKTAWKKPVFIAGFYWFFSKNFWKKPVFIGFFQNFVFFAFVCYFRISFFLFILLYSIISYLFPFHLPYNQVRHMLIPTMKW